MRGRPKTPTALSILRGNPGKRPLPKNEPKPAMCVTVPDWLTVGARKEWKLLAPMLERNRVLTEMDAETLGEMCEAKAVLKFQLREEGRFSTELWRAICAMEARFGLSPSDRARLSVEPPKPVSKLERFRGAKS